MSLIHCIFVVKIFDDGAQYGFQLRNTNTMAAMVTYAACEVPRTRTKSIMSRGGLG